MHELIRAIADQMQDCALLARDCRLFSCGDVYALTNAVHQLSAWLSSPQNLRDGALLLAGATVLAADARDAIYARTQLAQLMLGAANHTDFLIEATASAINDDTLIGLRECCINGYGWTVEEWDALFIIARCRATQIANNVQ